MTSDSTQTPLTQTQPQTQPQTPAQTPAVEPAFGWSSYAEIINGRFAMIGFMALLILELFTRQDFFSWLGLR